MWGFVGGAPEVDGGFVVDGDGLRGEPRRPEAAAEVDAVQGGDAQKGWEHGS